MILYMIGVGVITRGRRAIFSRSVAHWRRRMPPGSVLVVVDDASDDPVSDIDGATVIRNPYRLGVAMSKNRTIAALMDFGCDHLFLADDDVHPVHADWWKSYVESPEPHLSAQWRNRGKLDIVDDRHYQVVFPRGVMLYATRGVIDKVGGMDSSYGAFGGEHVEWQVRIFEAGLTTWKFADVLASQHLWYEVRTGSTVSGAQRRRILQCNGVQWQKPRQFVPYREGHGVQDFDAGPQLSDDVLQHVLGLQPTGEVLKFDTGMPPPQLGSYIVVDEQGAFKQWATEHPDVGWSVVGYHGEQWAVRVC